MADLTEHIAREIGVPVIDGVAAAVKLVEAPVGLGLGTSKVGDLAFPRSPSDTRAPSATWRPAPAKMRSLDDASWAQRRRFDR
jgi:hypothetical protein